MGGAQLLLLLRHAGAVADRSGRIVGFCSEALLASAVVLETMAQPCLHHEAMAAAAIVSEAMAEPVLSDEAMSTSTLAGESIVHPSLASEALTVGSC